MSGSQRKGLTSGEVRELPGSLGNFRGSLGNFRGTSGLLSSSTVRELPGKSPKNFRGIRMGKSGDFPREVLNGVGVDGVGVKFPIFPVNCSYLPLVLGQREEKRKKGEIPAKKGEIPAQKAKKTAKKRRKRGDSLQPHLHRPPSEPLNSQKLGGA